MITHEAKPTQPKAIPLKGKARFDELFASGRRFGTSDCSAIVNFSGKDPRGSLPAGKTEFRFAAIVPKRNAKRAVLRNRIKRLLRESVRKACAEFSDRIELATINAVAFVWRNAPAKPGLIALKDVEPVVHSLFVRILDYAGREIKKKNSEGA